MSDGQSEVGGPYSKYVLSVLILVYIFNQVDRNVLSILAEEIKVDIGISDAEMGFLFGTAFAVFFSVFGIPGGNLSYHSGSYRSAGSLRARLEPTQNPRCPAAPAERDSMRYEAERVEDIPIPPPANYIGQAVDHPCFAPYADDEMFLESAPYLDRLEGSDEVALSAQDIEQFKSQGFVVKHGLIDDPKALASLVDYFWDHVPNTVMDRDDPATWVNDPASRITTEEAERLGHFEEYTFKLRSPHGLGTEKYMLDATANHRNVRNVVEQLLRPPVKLSERTRGIYAIFPKPTDAPAKRLTPHTDPLASHLLAMVLIADIPPRSGGFTMWPGAHARLHPYFDKRNGGSITDPKRLEAYIKERDEIVHSVTPAEIVGSAGDVVFWHPRMIHSGGVNYSADTDNPCVRLVVPCDFQRGNYTYYEEETYGPSEREMWWVDSRHYHEDVAPTADNLWAEWQI